MGILFLLPLTSGALTYNYDNYIDGQVNTSLWFNNTAVFEQNTSQPFYIGQDFDVEYGITGTIRTINFLSTLDIQNYLSNISVNVVLQGGNTNYNGGTCSAEFNAFGIILDSESQGCNSLSFNSDNIWDLVYNITSGNIQAYEDGILYTSFAINSTSTTNLSTTVLIGASAGSGYLSGKIHTINYTLRRTSFVNLTSIADGVSIISNPSFNATIQTPTSISGTTFTLKNATLYVWNSTNGIINRTTTTITGQSNQTSYTTVPITMPDTYKWNVLACNTIHECYFADSNRTFMLGINFNQESHINNLTETSLARFYQNISIPAGKSISSSYLIWNGTYYLSTSSLISGNNYSLFNSFDIPTISSEGNRTFYWQVNYSSGESFTSQNYSHHIAFLNFTSTSSSGFLPYINFTFKNETALQQSISASISSMSVVYYAGSGTVNKTFNFISATENNNYTFYVSPQSSTITSLFSITYTNSISTQRQYIATHNLTNTTTEKTLYLLPTSVGSLISFQILNLADQPISGAIVNVTREGFGLVESRTTSDSGTVTFFLDPLTTYTVCAWTAATGSFCTTDIFIIGTYTIVLGSGGATGDPVSYTQGMTWTILPSGLSVLNNTLTSFNFTLASTVYTVTQFGFILYNQDGVAIGSASTSANGGIVNLAINTGLNQTITMNAYWVVSGNYTNITRTWFILNTDDSDFSISRFFTDLRLYMNSSNDSDGIFGLRTSTTNISLSLLLFFVILIITGITVRKYGVVSEIGILGIVFALVFLFDVVLQLLPRPLGNAPIATVILGIIYIVLIIREARN